MQCYRTPNVLTQLIASYSCNISELHVTTYLRLMAAYHEQISTASGGDLDEVFLYPQLIVPWKIVDEVYQVALVSKCQECERRDATLYCQECRQELCNKCTDCIHIVLRL